MIVPSMSKRNPSNETCCGGWLYAACDPILIVLSVGAVSSWWWCRCPSVKLTTLRISRGQLIVAMNKKLSELSVSAKIFIFSIMSMSQRVDL